MLDDQCVEAANRLMDDARNRFTPMDKIMIQREVTQLAAAIAALPRNRASDVRAIMTECLTGIFQTGFASALGEVEIALSTPVVRGGAN